MIEVEGTQSSKIEVHGTQSSMMEVHGTQSSMMEVQGTQPSNMRSAPWGVIREAGHLRVSQGYGVLWVAQWCKACEATTAYRCSPTRQQRGLLCKEGGMQPLAAADMSHRGLPPAGGENFDACFCRHSRFSMRP